MPRTWFETPLPCCATRALCIGRGAQIPEHYRCPECRLLFVWQNLPWVPCSLPETHAMLSHVGVLRGGSPAAQTGPVEKWGSKHS